MLVNHFAVFVVEHEFGARGVAGDYVNCQETGIRVLFQNAVGLLYLAFRVC